MKIFLILILACISTLKISAQKRNKIDLFLFADYNKTIYDRTIDNNPWSLGIGTQALINTRSVIKPAIEFNIDEFLQDDDVLRVTDDRKPIEDVREIADVLGGVWTKPSANTYFSFSGGPAFLNNKTYLALKPSFGFFFSKSQRLTGKVSYLNIFNREQYSKQDYGSVSIALGIKLF